jgi:hypothetical protein
MTMTPRPGRVGVVVAVSAAVLLMACAGVTGVGVATAGAVGVQAAAPRVNWGTAAEVPGLGALNAGGSAAVNVVSCWRAGDCAAGGFYADAARHQQAFVVTEHDGVWGLAEEVPGTAALNGDTSASSAQVSALSCAPSGYCAAAGDYDSGGVQQVFVVSETQGQWGTAREIPGVGKLNVGGYAWVDAVSCPSAGNCGAGGAYQTPVPQGTPIGQDSQAFVVSESKGRWSKAEEVPGMQAVSPPPFQVNYVRSMSCRSAGNCTAAGVWNAGPNGSPKYGQDGGFVVSEVKGRWQHLQLPTHGGGDSLLSCSRVGDCLATAGSSAVTQTRGRWGKVHNFASLQGDDISAVSCPSPGDCTVGGFLGYSDDDYGGYNNAFVLAERDGHWRKVYDLTGVAGDQLNAPFSALSCASPGNCGAGGSAIAGFDQYGNTLNGAFVVGERDGRWTASETPPGLAALNAGGNAAVNAVACPVASTCAAAGFYTDASGHQQAFVEGSV